MILALIPTMIDIPCCLLIAIKPLGESSNTMVVSTTTTATGKLERGSPKPCFHELSVAIRSWYHMLFNQSSELGNTECKRDPMLAARQS